MTTGCPLHGISPARDQEPDLARGPRALSGADQGHLPPGPRSTLWSSLAFMRSPAGFYRTCVRRFGDTFTVPGVDGVVVTTVDPELAREIYRAPHDRLGESVDLTEPAIGPGSVFLLRGEAAKRERKLLMPLFQGRRIMAYADTIRGVAEDHAGRWDCSRPVVLRKALNDVSLEIIVRCLLGLDGRERVSEAAGLVDSYVATFSPAMLYFERLRRPWFPAWNRFIEARERLRAFLRDQIRERQQDGEQQQSVLSALLHARYDDGTRIGESALIDELVTLLLAGHETTSIGMTWTLYWLERSPQVMRRVRTELAALPSSPSSEELAALSWLDAACKEALRIYPVTSRINRKVLDRPFKLGPWTVPPGVAVGTSITGIHQREDLFPDPYSFRPERFLEGTFGPHEYMPFGGGVRRCLGAALAEQEMRMVLALVLQRFDLRAVSRKPVVPVRRSVTMAPKGDVPMWLQPRR